MRLVELVLAAAAGLLATAGVKTALLGTPEPEVPPARAHPAVVVAILGGDTRRSSAVSSRSCRPRPRDGDDVALQILTLEPSMPLRITSRHRARRDVRGPSRFAARDRDVVCGGTC
jgi:hypothetical protein